MMKSECDLIRDLLPLYQDGVASEASRNAVDEHLLSCRECRSYKKGLDSEHFLQTELAADDETIAFAKVAKRIKKRKMYLSACLALFVIIVFFFAQAYAVGKRIDSFTAAQNSRWIDEESVLLDELDMYPYHIYLYENEDKYRTIVTHYAFPFWEPGGSSWANKTDDVIKLVGWYSGGTNGKGVTVVPIKSFDEKVAYIEMGSTDRLRKEVRPGQIVVFSWSSVMRWNELDGIAYSEAGEPLYKLGYETSGQTIKTDELRWLPVSE